MIMITADSIGDCMQSADDKQLMSIEEAASAALPIS